MKKFLLACVLLAGACDFNYSCRGDEDEADVDSDLDVDGVHVDETVHHHDASVQ